MCIHAFSSKYAESKLGNNFGECFLNKYKNYVVYFYFIHIDFVLILCIVLALYITHYNLAF